MFFSEWMTWRMARIKSAVHRSWAGCQQQQQSGQTFTELCYTTPQPVLILTSY